MEDSVLTVTRAVAKRVKALRQARSWSLDELAYRSKVSKGMLVQIEGAKTNPSIGTLARVADAFGVSIAQLVEGDQSPRVRVIGVDEPPTLWTGDRGGTARLLCGISDPAPVELWEWRLGPHERHLSPDHPTRTRELLHVLEGGLVVTLDGQEYPTGVGETVEFFADRPHEYVNPGAAPARFTMVVAAP